MRPGSRLPPRCRSRRASAAPRSTLPWRCTSARTRCSTASASASTGRCAWPRADGAAPRAGWGWLVLAAEQAAPEPAPPALLFFRCCRSCRRLCRPSHQGCELLEELAGELLGGGVDQPPAELRELAADIGLGLVAQEGAGAVIRETDGGAPLGVAGDPALAFA